jgi:lysine 2,3-aminomutase
MASKDKIDAAIDWIAANPAVNEVLVTGGDPLVMTDDKIRYVLERLSRIETVWRIRIGSRTPVVLPQRITDELADLIASFQQPGRREIVIVTHFEHSSEITPQSMEAIQKFRRRGLYCYNQTVFTIQNCRRYEVSVLRRWLRQIGVEPYYTFNAKGKQETDFYRVPLARLQQEAREEARLLPGMARTDEPVFNVPGLGKNYLRAEQNHLLLTILPDGRRVYEFHPWEKYISNIPSYIHADLALYDYLKKLETLGENPEDYKSIYYYF